MRFNRCINKLFHRGFFLFFFLSSALPELLIPWLMDVDPQVSSLKATVFLCAYFIFSSNSIRQTLHQPHNAYNSEKHLLIIYFMQQWKHFTQSQQLPITIQLSNGRRQKRKLNSCSKHTIITKCSSQKKREVVDKFIVNLVRMAHTEQAAVSCEKSKTTSSTIIQSGGLRIEVSRSSSYMHNSTRAREWSPRRSGSPIGFMQSIS